jgi:hypothetical protein
MDLESLRMTKDDVEAMWHDSHGVEKVVLTDYERAEILPHVQQAMIGGRSDIFYDTGKRRAELGENQLVGLGCEAAFFKWAQPLGSGGIKAWLSQRCLRNQSKRAGDGGFDCVLSDGTKVDVKSSECNGSLTVRGARNYHLTQCRSKTLADVAYVQCHTKRHPDSYQVPKVVLLAGWLWGHELHGREDHRDMRGWSAKCASIRKMKELCADGPHP